METRVLPFHELFHEANPFYSPSDPEEEDAETILVAESGGDPSNQDHSADFSRKASFSLISVEEPPPSENAKDHAQCFDYSVDNIRASIGPAPYEWLPDWKLLRDFLRREGRLELNTALELVKRARNILQKEPNVLTLRPPYMLVGDVHGQYYDVLSMFEKIGEPDTTPFLFLGDYVDRGMFGCEIVFLLCALKINYPNTFHLIRGNHECRLLTSHFTFLREVSKKYRSQRLYEEIMLLFDALPLAVLLEDEESRFLCVHGGLSPDIKSIDDIEALNRFQEPGKSGPLCDLLWSDPLEEDTASGLSESDLKEWYEVTYVENPTRGCGYVFGYAATKEFLSANGLTAIIRAHEVQRAGYGLNRFQQQNPEPLVITVFSAPNYCDFYNNKAAVMKVSPPRYDTDDEQDQHTRLEFVQFDCVSHPFWLPKLQDGIEYTMPFLVDKLMRILKYIVSDKGLGDEEPEEAQFYVEIEDMMQKHHAEQEAHKNRSAPGEPNGLVNSSASGATGDTSNAIVRQPSRASVLIPRTPSRKQLLPEGWTPPTTEESKPKEFLTVKERINMLHKDVEAKAELVKRLSSMRGDLIQGKILQHRLQAYLTKATTRFQKAKQVDMINEGLPGQV